MNFVLNYSTGYIVFIGPKEKKDEYSELPSELNSEQKKSAQHQLDIIKNASGYNSETTQKWQRQPSIKNKPIQKLNCNTIHYHS